MIGSLLTRGLVMVFGYAYPAYECFKSVEKNKPDIEQLRFWCQYWILVALLTVCERFGDMFISWVPMYSEAKLAFYIYLWFPKTKGTTYVYDSFFRPYIAKHEMDIDRSLLELRTRAADFAVMYSQRAFSYGQTRIFDILQYVASQSIPKPRPAQPQSTQGASVRQPATGPNHKPETEEQPPALTSSPGPRKKDVVEEVGSPKVPTPSSSSSALKVTTSQTALETSKSSSSSDAKVMEVVSSSSTSENTGNNSSPPETVMEDGIRITRSRLRKTHGAAIHK